MGEWMGRWASEEINQSLRKSLIFCVWVNQCVSEWFHACVSQAINVFVPTSVCFEIVSVPRPETATQTCNSRNGSNPNPQRPYQASAWSSRYFFICGQASSEDWRAHQTNCASRCLPSPLARRCYHCALVALLVSFNVAVQQAFRSICGDACCRLVTARTLWRARTDIAAIAAAECRRNGSS